MLKDGEMGFKWEITSLIFFGGSGGGGGGEYFKVQEKKG